MINNLNDKADIANSIFSKLVKETVSQESVGNKQHDPLHATLSSPVAQTPPINSNPPMSRSVISNRQVSSKVTKKDDPELAEDLDEQIDIVISNFKLAAESGYSNQRLASFIYEWSSVLIDDSTETLEPRAALRLRELPEAIKVKWIEALLLRLY